MKTLSKILLLFLLLLVAAMLLGWTFRTKIVSYYLSRSLNNAPSSVRSFDYEKGQFHIKDIAIYTFSGESLFFAKNSSVSTDLGKLLKERIVVDLVQISDVAIHITINEDGSTNWDPILKTEDSSSSATLYLIKELQLKNLTVSVTDSKGKKTDYPVIDEMTFRNISSETGLPLEEVQKAIFRLILRKIVEEFGIKTMQDVLKRILPDPSSLPFFRS